MQNTNIDIHATTDGIQFFIPAKKTGKPRKWREIEALKARRELVKELQDIDPSFDFSSADFF